MRELISNEHFSLRKYRPGDEHALFEGVNESIKELTRWGFYHTNFTLEDARDDVAGRIDSWNQGNSYTFFIETSPASLFAGNCSLNELEPENNRAALGWWVRTSQVGKGIATAAGSLVARAAFEDLNLASILIYTNAENKASRRVAEKIGAELANIKPEENGIFCAVYELKPEDLRLE